MHACGRERCRCQNGQGSQMGLSANKSRGWGGGGGGGGAVLLPLSRQRWSGQTPVTGLSKNPGSLLTICGGPMRVKRGAGRRASASGGDGTPPRGAVKPVRVGMNAWGVKASDPGGGAPTAKDGATAGGQKPAARQWSMLLSLACLQNIHSGWLHDMT